MIIYVAFPVAYAVIHAQPIRSYGLRMGLFRGDLRIFAVLLPVIVAGAYLSAGQPRFQETYPFYTDWSAGRGTVLGLLTWWVLYALTFVTLEFFYRGFLVTAGFPLLGWWAIPAMAAPYCLLHLDKPVPEMVTSLFGGLVLGVVALRTRSILAGVLAHVTLAVGTDAAVLARR
jgi:membrane protease YdiL (CAAX protease family)